MKLKSALESYPDFWQEIKSEPILNLLSQVTILECPRQKLLIPLANKLRTIVVLTEDSLAMARELLEQGFCHCLSKSRKDFASEILAATLIILRPQVLANNQIPFFFRRFLKLTGEKESSKNFLFKARSNRDRSLLVPALDHFLKSNDKLANIKDLALEINEELFKNAFFHGAISQSTVSKIGGYNKRSEISLNEARAVNVFCAYDDEMVIIGCSDTFGKLDRASVLSHILRGSTPDPLTGERQQIGANGIGLKMCLDNSASIYFYGEPNSRTIVTCGLLLGGLRANMIESKHIHLSLT